MEAEKAGLQKQREQEAAGAHEEVERRAAEATAAALEEAEKKIRRETPPGGSRLDTLRRFFEGGPASRTKINLDAENSRSSEDSGPATRPRRKGKERTPERSQWPAERHRPALRPLGVSAASPICSDFQTFCPDWLHFGLFLCFGGIAASQLSHRIFPIYF